ncbi:fkbp-type peptidyl-prolyl cis-trans isomerase fkpa [gamma proteobacterium HTCC5015]|nr:fkbp-type peptidyl-prolyl cis-trans isomerase fkpa [gamma proteobacterium HTCC5015]
MFRSVFAFFFLITVATSPLRADEAERLNLSPEEEQAVLAYSLGYNVAARMLNDFPSLNLAEFRKGMQAAYDQEPSKYDVSVMQTVVDKHKRLAQERLQSAVEQLAQNNRQKSQAFLAKNAKKTSVTTTESGLQYEVIEEGDGISPKIEDEVLVHYHGTLIDGRVFDSSVERGEPVTLHLEKVISGWREGLLLMRRGGKFKFYIPPELGYGAQSMPGMGPNQVLVFEVELLEVVR